MNKAIARTLLKLRHGGWRITGRPSSYEELFERERRSGFRYTRLRALASLGYEIDLERPRSLNEKLIHRRLFSRDEVWPLVTDKVAVREWLRGKGLLNDVRLIPALDIFSDPGKFDFSTLCEPVVVKAAWASAYNFFLRDGPGDIVALRRRLEAMRDAPYQVERLVWASHRIPRRFIVERLLLGPDGKVPSDYKFFVFHGKVRLIEVDVDRFSGHRRCLFYPDGTKAPIEYLKPDGGFERLPEAVTGRMAPIAERLGAEFDFIRVDLYLHEGEVYFGELTQTPHLGFGDFRPRRADFELGEMWNYRPNGEA